MLSLLKFIHQLAISSLPGSLAVAIIGVIVGQLYRSEIANFNTYRLPMSVVTFSRRFLLPLIGSLRGPRRLTRAFPDDARAAGVQQAGLAALGNDEVITTSRRNDQAQASLTRSRNSDGGPGVSDGSPGAGSSVMREWVDELTGRTDRANSGIRVPTESEISQLTNMFPTVEREVVVGALQGRYATFQFFSGSASMSTFDSFLFSPSPNIEGAVETLLSARS